MPAECRRKMAWPDVLAILIVIVFAFSIISMLIPGMAGGHHGGARRFAVMAQANKLAMGLETFRTDFGHYPSSTPQDFAGVTMDRNAPQGAVNGFHRMAFALLGRDRGGSPAKHPDDFKATHYYKKGTTKPEDNITLWGTNADKAPRKGLYINPESFSIIDDKAVDPNGFVPVLCDKFDKRTGTDIARPGDYEKHSIFLYFAASESGKRIGGPPAQPWSQELYYAADNWRLMKTDAAANLGHATFWNFIENVKAKDHNDRQPNNPDTFLLISAGGDGNYFTDDDIVNWEK